MIDSANRPFEESENGGVGMVATWYGSRNENLLPKNQPQPVVLYSVMPGPTESVGADLGLYGAYWIIVVIICHCSKSRR